MFESWPEMWGGGYPAYRTTLRKFLWFRTVTGGNAPKYQKVTGKIVSFLTQRIAPLKIEADLEPIQSGTGDPSPENIRPISGHTGADIFVKAEYDAQATPTVTVNFGTTVYGGQLTVFEDGSGQIVADMATESWKLSTFSGSSSLGSYTRAYHNLSNICSNSNPTDVCNVAPFATGWASDSLHFYCYLTSNNTPRVVVFLPNGTDGDTDIQVCYKLATPITIPLTPGQVNALQGDNTVWLDTGDDTEITVTYQSN